MAVVPYPVELDIHDPLVPDDLREQIYEQLDTHYRSNYFHGDTLTFTFDNLIYISIRPQVQP